MAPLPRTLRPAARGCASLLRSRPAAMRTSLRAAHQQQQQQQRHSSSNDTPSEQGLEVGELQGAKLKIEPLRRTGEDAATMRARLLYQCRKRGILESDLLLSTFAAAHLPTMSPSQLAQLDLFLDENDWDIYYWATQEEVDPEVHAQQQQAQQGQQEQAAVPPPTPRNIPGEWAQTVGAFKPAYRPVPARWKDSEILAMLREHVRRRSGEGKGGMAFMPSL